MNKFKVTDVVRVLDNDPSVKLGSVVAFNMQDDQKVIYHLSGHRISKNWYDEDELELIKEAESSRIKVIYKTKNDELFYCGEMTTNVNGCDISESWKLEKKYINEDEIPAQIDHSISTAITNLISNIKRKLN